MTPENGRWDRALQRPRIQDCRRCGRDGSLDFLRTCTRKPGFRLKAGDCTANQLVYELAKGDRVELERFGLQADRTPVKRVAPHEAEGIPQQTLERRCRLGSRQSGHDSRMIWCHQAVMGCQRRVPLPISPAELALSYVLELRCVAWPGQEAVRLAESMPGNAISLMKYLVRGP